MVLLLLSASNALPEVLAELTLLLVHRRAKLRILLEPSSLLLIQPRAKLCVLVGDLLLRKTPVSGVLSSRKCIGCLELTLVLPKALIELRVVLCKSLFAKRLLALVVAKEFPQSHVLCALVLSHALLESLHPCRIRESHTSVQGAICDILLHPHSVEIVLALKLRLLLRPIRLGRREVLRLLQVLLTHRPVL